MLKVKRIFSAIVVLALLSSSFVFSSAASISNSTSIQLNSPITDHLAKSSDIKYYSFTLPSAGKLNIKFSLPDTNNGNWKVTLTDKNNNEYLSFYTKDGEMEKTTSNAYLPSNTYYLKVSKYYDYSDINYTFTANFEADTGYFEKEFNNKMSTANPIRVNEEYIGSLQNSSDVDYYRMDLSKAGKLNIGLRLPDASNSNWKVTLLDKNNVSYISFYTKDGDMMLSSPDAFVPQGVYYLKIEKYYDYGDMDYMVTANFEADTGNFEKEFNNKMSTANPIQVNNEYTGCLQNSSDADYYSIDFASACQVKIDFKLNDSNSGNWKITLIDKNNKTIQSFYTKDNEMEKTSPLVNVSSGRYYVKVEKYYDYSSIDYMFTVIK